MIILRWNKHFSNYKRKWNSFNIRLCFVTYIFFKVPVIGTQFSGVSELSLKILLAKNMNTYYKLKALSAFETVSVYANLCHLFQSLDTEWILKRLDLKKKLTK